MPSATRFGRPANQPLCPARPRDLQRLALRLAAARLDAWAQLLPSHGLSPRLRGLPLEWVVARDFLERAAQGAASPELSLQVVVGAVR